jgi:hypothetical protein
MISATSLLIIESAMELYIKRKKQINKELRIFEKKLGELGNQSESERILRWKAITKIESNEALIVQCREALKEGRTLLDKN